MISQRLEADCACLLLVLVVAACAGSRDRLTELGASLPGGVGGWNAEESELYDAESIYSYIDGHAEVYLAYGMRACLARRYAAPEGEADLVVDVFEMASAADAFGVFTHDRDGEPVEVGTDGLLRSGWLSFWKGPFFVSVYAERESDRSRAAVLGLARGLDAAILESAPRPSIMDRLPAAGLDESSVRFLRSHQILNSHLWLSDRNFLGLGPDVAAALALYARGGDSATLLVVEYPSPGRRAAAVRAFSSEVLGGADGRQPVQHAEGGWYAAVGSGNELIAVLAASSEELAADLAEEVVTGGAS
jgi:hypothetical protein